MPPSGTLLSRLGPPWAALGGEASALVTGLRLRPGGACKKADRWVSEQIPASWAHPTHRPLT